MSGIARSESSKHLLAWMLLGWRSIFHLNLVFLVDIRFIQIWKYFFLKNLKCSPFFLDALRYYLDTAWMLAYMPDLIDCCTFHVWFLCSCCTWVSCFLLINEILLIIIIIKMLAYFLLGDHNLTPYNHSKNRLAWCDVECHKRFECVFLITNWFWGGMAQFTIWHLPSFFLL